MRQFILQKNPDKKGLVQLKDKDYRYLCQVLRVRQGDMVEVRLPDGNLQKTTVAFIDSSARIVTLQICANTESTDKSITRGVKASQIQTEDSSSKEYWLFQFIPKPQKFEQIVRQATECGIHRIIPVISDFSEKSSVLALEGAKKERLEKIIKEARQQSGSPVNTIVNTPVSLEEACKMWSENLGEKAGAGIILSERNDNSKNISEIFDSFDKNNLPEKYCIVVGNEGGISPKEIDFLLKKGLFIPVHFVVNILRCETAALYGIAAVQAYANAI